MAPLPKTTVVKIDPKHPTEGYDHYIGRPFNKYGLAGSLFGNPYKIGIDGTRAECLRKYRNRLMTSPGLLALIPTLRGKRLGCWCHSTTEPDFQDPYCHGDILAHLADSASTAILPLNRALDPTTQECFGFYGYGSGFYAAEGANRARANLAVGGSPPPAFCDTCPKRGECWIEHQRRVGIDEPTEVSRYFEDVARFAYTHPDTPKSQVFGMVAATRAEHGDPDPWMAGILRNFQHADRVRQVVAPPPEPGTKPS